MSEQKDENAQRIREMIESGAITQDRLEDYLKETIDKEINRQDREADQQLIQSCLDLLSRLHGDDDNIPLPQKNFADVLQRAHRIQTRQRIQRFSARVAVVLLVFVIGGIVYQYRTGGRVTLISQSSPDEQIYRITGTVQGTGLLAEGEAEASEESVAYSDIPLVDALRMADLTISMPSWLPDGFAPVSYNLMKSELRTSLSMSFSAEGQDQLLRYLVYQYNDPEALAFSFEQDAVGVEYSWKNKEVYVTTNMGATVGIWRDTDILFHVSGPITNDDLRKMIESM